MHATNRRRMTKTTICLVLPQFSLKSVRKNSLASSSNAITVSSPLMETLRTHSLSTGMSKLYVFPDYRTALLLLTRQSIPLTDTHLTLADHIADNLTGCIQRMNIQHDLLRELLGGNIVAAVRHLLTQRSLQRQIKVLDLCTGTGKWYS